MAMQHIEDMNDREIDCLVSVLLEEDPKLAADIKPQPIPKLLEPGDSEGLWNMIGHRYHSGKTAFK